MTKNELKELYEKKQDAYNGYTVALQAQYDPNDFDAELRFKTCQALWFKSWQKYDEALAEYLGEQ